MDFNTYYQLEGKYFKTYFIFSIIVYKFHCISFS